MTEIREIGLEHLAPRLVCIDDWIERMPALVRTDTRWNGFACPYFSREVAQSIITDCNTDATVNPSGVRFAWDGDTLVQTDQNYEDEADFTPERIDPVLIDGVMHWCIGGWSWVWKEERCEVCTDDCTPDAVTVVEGDFTHMYCCQTCADMDAAR